MEFSIENFDKHLIGFGIYASLTYRQFAETKECESYIKWLFSQDFFNEKYPDLYSYLCGLGQKPKRHNIAKSHREIQARFIDEKLVRKLVKVIFEDEALNFNIEKVVFEDLSNADMAIYVKEVHESSSSFSKVLGTNVDKYVILVEIKPRVSNDYPEVLLQMRKQLHSYKMYNEIYRECSNIFQVLITKKYRGDISLDTVREIFGDIEIVFLKELETSNDKEE